MAKSKAARWVAARKAAKLQPVQRKPAEQPEPLSLTRACWLLENLKRELAVAHLEADARINYLLARLAPTKHE